MRRQALPPGSPPTATWENTRVYLHRAGTEDSADKVIFGADVTPELKLPKAGFAFGGPLHGSPLLMAGETRGTIDTPAVWIKSLGSV